MEKNIPVFFDASIIDSSLQDLLTNNSNISRMKVRAFTKYANRNGSYITDEVADQLIKSAIQGDTPVIGFFDPSTKTWASHTGPTLANGYGYVENFLGWEKFRDTDGIEREYAVFSVVLFTKYYEEAKKILGQNHSMELDPTSISGQWVDIDGQELFVYSTASILGFCVIGAHEPCFSVSAFFAKKEDNNKEEENNFFSLINELKLLVQLHDAGGVQPMNEFENDNSIVNEVVEQTPQEISVEENDSTIQEEVTNFEEVQENVEEVKEDSENNIENNIDIVEENNNELRAQFETLQNQLNELQDKYNELMERYSSIEEAKKLLDNENSELKASLSTYQQQAVAIELEKKNQLFDKYEKIIGEEEINNIREQINDLSYDELESKLAIIFAKNYVEKSETTVQVPLAETPQESQFALLMKKYRKS